MSSKARWYLVTATELGGMHVIESFETKKEAEASGKEWFDGQSKGLLGKSFVVMYGRRVASKLAELDCALCADELARRS